jgi:D-glycero-D-manno-heptose 1,7-bisphosphate phosphatase
MLRPALFADRDGTIVVEKHYLADPDLVEIIPGAAHALKRFADAGYAIIVVTNQSGIGRGFYTEADFHRVQQRIAEILAGAGVTIDGVYFCPHSPEQGTPCECRKPGTGMYLQAAREHRLDLRLSIYVGDRPSDVEAAAVLGGRGILVRTGYGAGAAGYDGEVASDLTEVAERVLGEARGA